MIKSGNLRIRDKKFKYGTYRYEIISTWDKKKKKTVKKSKYLGKVDTNTNELIVKKTIKSKTEKAILDFGDSAILNHIIKINSLDEIIYNSFPAHFDSIMSLVIYQIISQEALVHASSWFDGNIIQKIYPKANLTSQNISRVLKYLANDKNIDFFFKFYVDAFFPESRGILIDSSAFSNSTSISLNNWGYNDGKIDKNISCIMLVDQVAKLPIYFRPVAGNISDVSVLKQSLHDLNKLEVKISKAIFDARFYSEGNLKLLIDSQIDFITRVPKNRKIFTNLSSEFKTLQDSKNIVKYNKRGLFIKDYIIDFFDKKLHGYIILDPERKGKEISKLILNHDNIHINENDIDFDSKGVFMLLSSKKLDINDVMPLYYARQDFEVIFDICKNKTNMLPLRKHSMNTCKGHMLLCFLSIICYVLLREKLVKSKYNTSSLFLILRNLKSKVYYDNSVSVFELNKQQKEIYEILDFDGAY